MRRYTVEINGTPYVIDVQEIAAERYKARVHGAEFEVHLADNEPLAGVPVAPVLADQPATRSPSVSIAPSVPMPTTPAVNQPDRLDRSKAATHAGHGITVVAPLPGLIESILVSPHDYVNRGDSLLVLEAMKMRNTIQAAEAGFIKEILVQPGQTVRYGDALLSIEREAQ